MSNFPESPTDHDRSDLAAVRETLRQAVKDGDADKVANLVTYDVVAVHADGRCTSGKSEVEEFFQDLFDRYDIKGTISSSEVVIHGIWAVEIDEIQTKRTQYGSPISADVPLQAVFVFARQVDDSWKVARIIELPE